MKPEKFLEINGFLIAGPDAGINPESQMGLYCYFLGSQFPTGKEVPPPARFFIQMEKSLADQQNPLYNPLNKTYFRAVFKWMGRWTTLLIEGNIGILFDNLLP